MKNKKKIIIIITIILTIILGFLGYYLFTKEDKDSTLTLIEKQWIESNKNNVIDMSIINDIPLLSYNGEGIIVDFLTSLKETTNLSFNKVSYNFGNEFKSEYAFKLTSEVNEKDMVIYDDNYIIVTKDNVNYRSIEELRDLKIGVTNFSIDPVNNYLYNAKVSYVTFADEKSMIEEFNKDTTELDAIILLKTVNLKSIIDNKYHIAYNIAEYTEHFVLSLGENEKLNNILIKYYNKWKAEHYNDSYNKHLVDNYFTFNNIDDSQEVKFRSKRYIYGFFDNSPYDITLDGKLSGINNQTLAAFSDFADVEISYKHYNDIDKIVKAFNTNEIDFFYGINSNTEYLLDVYNTIPVYSNNIVILIHASNDLVVNSIKSLENEEILVANNTKMQNYLTATGLKVKGYDNDSQLLSNINKDSVIVMDLNNYNYHVKKGLSDYIIVSLADFTDANFVIRDINDNKIFNELLNFFISFKDTKSYVNDGLEELLLINMAPVILKRVAIILGVSVSVLLLVMVIIKLKPSKKKKTNFTKEDKLRYVDSLTSLKNRNYLNDNMEKWDNSEVYPQAIVIIDLNNIAYINDNYGHPEGDSVIEQAANILIMNQIDNSEIVRTNGNEFLIYLVGYDEKQIITYMRKLGKELKELSHGFGSAIGYSMIVDAIKTIDDAINEATLDMRNNKEETNN